ncbi:hypothetical protein [uncultured Desulfuromusa sp.]|uniref:hypothetical protein n=1 Tax=uncultured Desulfuromusa sp. TaxID=219183 RepID=UPI002AA80309|nr:hypothetical protein [uncultured Desulfuromusa sp.]
MNFVISFISEHAALLFSALALWASWRANSQSKIALAQSNKAKLLELQNESLREIDLQHAKLGALLAVTAEAALAYSQNEKLIQENPGGYDRLKNNIETVLRLQSRYDEQRNFAESSLGEGSLEKQIEILANIRRLTVHINEDIEKEKTQLRKHPKKYWPNSIIKPMADRSAVILLTPK